MSQLDGGVGAFTGTAAEPVAMHEGGRVRERSASHSEQTPTTSGLTRRAVWQVGLDRQGQYQVVASESSPPFCLLKAGHGISSGDTHALLGSLVSSRHCK